MQAQESDLRRVGLHPDFWHPLAMSGEIKRGGMLGVSFAGEPIVLCRADKGEVFALEDRCAHRQVPLRAGVLCGDAVRCGYHGWAFGKDGRCLTVPNLGKGEATPRGVRAYPCREAYGLIFVFTGAPEKAEAVQLPCIDSAADPEYKTRFLSKRINCHYSFMHENLMDMNHQFLHRRYMGSIQPLLLKVDRGEDWVEGTYTFNRVAGRQSMGEKFMIGPRAKSASAHEHDLMVIRTRYPYQTLTFCRAGSDKPALDLWLSYVPVDREQRVNHSFGLMMIRRPAVPGLIHLFWPFIVLFTNAIFGQDQWIVEQEQRAHDAQGRDMNQEIFPIIRELRALLSRSGVPINL
ncbi:MAG: aromatic ring-hydroxylating dioxygenase subunit alpha [Elusimicrobia bacterium]|nr:aromatic ring-hydroxylating dioxygenase subunit alpha [Elusimicrobiota bacterium]